MNKTFAIIVATLTVAGLAACGSNSADELDLSAAAQAGRGVALEAGCASCHGADGQGTVGPPFVGLAGAERPIQGMAEPVIADREYLIESIVDPSAKLVEGYNLPMPMTELTEAEIDAIVVYIEELADVEP